MDIWIILMWSFSFSNFDIVPAVRISGVYGLFHSEEVARAWMIKAFPDSEDRRRLSIHQVLPTAP